MTARALLCLQKEVMKKHLLYIVLLVLFGLALRQLPEREIWYDEAFTAKMIGNSYEDIIKLSANDVHPPLYYLVTKPFNPYIRLPSLIFGLGTIVVAYILGWYVTRDFSKSIMAGVLISTSPFLIAYSNEARSYSMVAFLFVLVFYFFLKARREGKFLGFTVTLCLLLLTHYIGLLALPLCVVYMKAKPWFIVVVALTVLFVLPSFAKPRSLEGLTWIPKFTTQNITKSATNFVLGYEDADTSQPYFDRYFIGFFAILLVLVGVLLPDRVNILYAGICIGTILTYKPLGYGYKDLAYYIDTLDGQAVMTNATDYISTSYYSNKVKLQEGAWGGWVVIKATDVVDKSKTTNSFYLVNKGPIDSWECADEFASFCFYKWDN